MGQEEVHRCSWWERETNQDQKIILIMMVPIADSVETSETSPIPGSELIVPMQNYELMVCL
eukprot:COSAG02_NODE_7517_length_2976_cov_2.325686_1_plen_61_part_00